MYDKLRFKEARVPLTIVNYLHRDREIFLFLCLVIFHKNKLINDHSLHSNLCNLNKGILDRSINTYYCKIAKRWYQHTFILNIFKELILELSLEQQYVSMKELTQYVNKYTNRSYKHCINYIHNRIIIPYLDSYDYEDIIQEFNIIGDINSGIKYPSYDKFEPKGYCCEDCSGCYSNYKRAAYEKELKGILKDAITSKFEEYFKTVKVKLWYGVSI